MSRGREEKPLGLMFMERFSGLILLIVGVILAHQTSVNSSSLGGASVFFIVVSAILILLGLLMIVAETV
ncbi:MAG: hypothetical protein N3E47_03460 [Candidatus Bathyarchaeota archaeon]|nr:hypothetical protein [Candidatus Bathyarchaeota archaeon]